MSLIIDTSRTGIKKTLKEHEEMALRFIWSIGERGANSRRTWEAVNEQLEGKTISRASIINFLNRMVDQNVLDFRDATGKGGHQRVYYPKLDEKGYRIYLIKTVLDSLIRDFPEETREVITQYM